MNTRKVFLTKPGSISWHDEKIDFSIFHENKKNRCQVGSTVKIVWKFDASVKNTSIYYIKCFLDDEGLEKAKSEKSKISIFRCFFYQNHKKSTRDEFLYKGQFQRLTADEGECFAPLSCASKIASRFSQARFPDKCCYFRWIFDHSSDSWQTFWI